ncbi:MAG: choice-of-anchor tandem repeat NxxGxxAF-containing protein, partial [Planctomycetota bacterium]
VDPGSEFDALSGVRIRESNGSVLFRGDLGGPNINPFLDTGLFASRGVGLPENIVPIGGAFSGNMAYDITNGTIFTDIGFFQGGGFSLSSSIDPLLGGFGFTAELVGPGISLDDERSIGVVGREIARSGTQAPGLESGMRFAFFDAPPRIDLEGRAAFSADMQTLSDPDTFIDSVWLDTHGTLLPIAVGGRPAPGTADGVTFATGFQTLSPPAINGTGQLAFRGTVEGPGVTDANDRGFWATNDNGELVLALREGDVIDINPQPNITINRTISSLGGFAIDDGGRARSFNDLGQLALNVSFTDGTEAIIVATIETPCSPVDLSAPFGVISNADVSAFVNRFFADDPLVAALASPFDVVSNTDVDEFVRLFFEGCPAE